jgi:PASTA domain-containing protein
MGARPPALLSRVALFVVLGLFASATITFAASKKIVAASTTPTPAPLPAAVPLVVPDVRGEAYVFAKGILEDAGFAWHVASANGYAANTVVSQSPAPGTRVVDNGAPTISLTLTKNPRYAEKGSPENDAPFAGTTLTLVGVHVAKPAPAKPVVKPKPVTKPKPAVKAKPKPAVKAKPKPAVKVKPHAVTKKRVTARPPAFVVSGAPKEPLDEMPLTQRARQLDTWLDSHSRPTTANVRHWLYQHQWIVTGARFGWWHGAEALRILIQDDRRARKLWGIGSRSEATARHALAEVQARAK